MDPSLTIQLENIIMLRRAAKECNDQADTLTKLLMTKIEHKICTLTHTPFTDETHETPKTQSISENGRDMSDDTDSDSDSDCTDSDSDSDWDDSDSDGSIDPDEDESPEELEKNKIIECNNMITVMKHKMWQLHPIKTDRVKSLFAELDLMRAKATTPQVDPVVESVAVEQLVVGDDETAEDALKRECLSMLQKLSWIPPLPSMELEVNRVNHLFAEWEWMREQKLNKDDDDDSDDDSDDESEDDCPSFSPFDRRPTQKLINAWYGPYGERTDAESEAWSKALRDGCSDDERELAALLARRKTYDTN